MARLDYRRRDIQHADRAGFRILQDLFHWLLARQNLAETILDFDLFRQSLSPLPVGEGQGEGLRIIALALPLTPTLSQRETEQKGFQ